MMEFNGAKVVIQIIWNVHVLDEENWNVHLETATLCGNKKVFLTHLLDKYYWW